MRVVVKEHRAKLGLSIQQLAKMSGVGKGTIADVENGNQFPNSKTICRLSRALKVPVSDILICEDEPDDKADDTP